MKQAMIFAAGLGTRLKPLTDTMPKALVPVGGRPLIDIVVDRLQQAGYDRLVVNVHHFAQQVIDHIAASKYAQLVHISDERDQLLETGGGLKKAASLFTDDKPILIHNVDILSNVDFGWFARQHLPEEDAVLLVSRRKTKRYLLFDNAMRLMGWMNIETGEVKSPFPWVRDLQPLPRPLAMREKSGNSQGDDSADNLFIPLPHREGLGLSLLAFSGIHSFSPRLFPLMDRFPDRFPIMDFYLSTCHRAHIMGVVKDDLRMLDVGKLDTLAEAEKWCSLDSETMKTKEKQRGF
jgi:NDP-sugar pyrophosphorylase family protein